MDFENNSWIWEGVYHYPHLFGGIMLTAAVLGLSTSFFGGISVPSLAYFWPDLGIFHKRKHGKKRIRVYMDGCFDLMHYGHANALRQAKALGDELVVGVVSDEEIIANKGPPVLSMGERLVLVSGLKWVDEVIANAPYAITEQFMSALFNEHKIDYIIHGDDPCLLPDGTDAYALAKKAGRYKQIKRTEGVSSTDIVGRILSYVKDNKIHEDHNGSTSLRGERDNTNEVQGEKSQSKGLHLSHFLPTSRRIVQFSNGKGPGPNARVVYIDGAFDLFHAGHVEILKNARQLGDFLLVGIHTDQTVSEHRGAHFPIMHLHERSLSVLACRYVDEVIIGAPWEVTKDMMTTFNISLVVFNLYSALAASARCKLAGDFIFIEGSKQSTLISTAAMAKEGQPIEGKDVVSDLINFLNSSPTAFHAVDEAKKLLKKAGFVQVSERDNWNLEAGKRYFFTRNYSTIVAFAIGKKYVAGNGFCIVGAHTDSPCLKLKPISKVTKGGYLEVGVQTYGGGLWHTWFDRDLTVAGRVIIREGKDAYSHKLVRIEEPIMRIPNLAIHLDRGVNDGFKVNTHSHLVPVLATAIKAELNKAVAENGPADSGGDEKKSNERTKTDNSRHHSLLLQLLATQLGCEPDDICDFELQACDTQPSTVAGAMKEFIFSGRLDNLCMSFCSLKALIDATASESTLEDETGVRMVALFDHEEIGSNSAQGAGSPVMFDALSQITNSFTSDSKLLQIAIQRSFLVSADMAHALHPNYMDKHEENHQPKLHGGLVIKHNANQRYATNAVTSFIFREIAAKHNLPVQDFVVRNDMPCGSTIGPILASGVGIRTIDVGAPQLSMHSIREMSAVDDVKHSYEHFKAYFQEFSCLDAKITVDI